MVQLKPGLRTPVWAYNGSVPGPLIEVHEGDSVSIKLINQLKQPTTIHWHGLPVPPEQDGNPGSEIAPGKSRTYRFTLPVGSAGTYWFHPHPHGHTAEQVYRGLAGLFIVRSKADPLAHLPERHLVFSDLKLQANGRIADNEMDDWMNGREGQFVLVNGQWQPTLNVLGRQRWRLWNACSARYLRLKLPDQSMIQVGTDGGLLAAPVPVSELLLAPGERAEVVVSGDGNSALTALAYDRGKMGDVAPEHDVILLHAHFRIGVPTELPQQLRAIEALGQPVANKELVFSEDMDNMTDDPASMKFMINGKVFDMNRVDLTSKAGEVEAWTLRNDSDMDHPFHLHGTQFQVAERRFKGQTTPEKLLAWRDTVNVRPQESVVIHTVQKRQGAPRLSLPHHRARRPRHDGPDGCHLICACFITSGYMRMDERYGEPVISFLCWLQRQRPVDKPRRKKTMKKAFLLQCSPFRFSVPLVWLLLKKLPAPLMLIRLRNLRNT